MEKEINEARASFEDIKYNDNAGVEVWLGRDLMPLLGYVTWENFVKVIDKAKIACEQSGQAIPDQFRDVTKLVDTGSSAQREIEDIALTRYACYLIAQNGDPRKKEIAQAQTYFAIQTRKQEIFEKLGPAAQRLMLRTEVVDSNKRLTSAAKDHGVTRYANFHDAGYRGLYDMGVKQVERKKGLGRDKLLDRAGTTELAANLFRITQTEDVLSKEVEDGKKRGQRGAEQVHYTIGRRVRQTIKDNQGTMPENLPPEPEHIKQLQKRVDADQKKLQP